MTLAYLDMNATVSDDIANIALLHLPWSGGLVVVGEKRISLTDLKQTFKQTIDHL